MKGKIPRVKLNITCKKKEGKIKMAKAVPKKPRPLAIIAEPEMG